VISLILISGQCCDINCYTKGNCQKAYSDDCPSKAVECASGKSCFPCRKEKFWDAVIIFFLIDWLIIA